MFLDEIVISMGEQGEYFGELDFETLALAGYITEKNALVFLDDSKYSVYISSNNVVLTTRQLSSAINARGICICDNPRVLFFKIHNFLSTNTEYIRKVFPTEIGNNCDINKFSYIAKNNVIIGDNVIIEEFASIKENTIIGNNSIIRANSVIGGEGFEHKRITDGTVLSVRHMGGVIIGNNVEIQQLSNIEKAIYPWDNTIIEDYCKIDSLVDVAHSVRIKRCSFIVAGSKLGGRVEIGDNSWIGIGALIRNGIKIGNNSSVSIGSVVVKDVNDGQTVTGNFAVEHFSFLRSWSKAYLKKQ